MSGSSSSSRSLASLMRHILGRYTTITTNTRPITTKTKSRGAAQPMMEQGASQTYIVEPECKDLTLSSLSVADYVFKDAKKWSHKTAMECGLTGRSYTYAQVIDGAARFGSVLQQLTGRMEGKQRVDGRNRGHKKWSVMERDGKEELKEGLNKTTVAIFSPNCPEYPIVFFGSVGAGATVTGINPTYTPLEVAHHLQDSGSNVVVVDVALEGVLDAALTLLGREGEGVSVIVNGVSKAAAARPNLQHLVSHPDIPLADFVPSQPDSTAVLPYSSGTTGKPKGVVLSHQAFTNSLTIYHHPHTCVLTPAEGAGQEVFIGLLPFFHIYGMIVIMASGLTNGAKIVTVPQFNPQGYLSLLQKHKVSVLHLVPPLLNFLVQASVPHPHLLSSVHTAMCGAAPVPPTTAALLKTKAEKPIFFQEGFGMTEALCTHLTPIGQERLGWCGKLLPHVHAKVIHLESGESLPPGQHGEMYIQSPIMMTGYHNKPSATLAAFDSDGWFKTGDVVKYDEDGFFTIVDRLKELIKVKGLQVSPSELEDVLLCHPAVAEVGVIGVPDEKAGEVPRAYVVPKAEVKAEELCQFVSGRLAKHKQLTGGVVFIDQLPKNATGKLLRKQLRKMALGE